MMLWMIARQQGVDIAEAVSQHFLHERIGQPGRNVITPLSEQTKLEQPKLAEALSLMEANIEEPLSTDDISFHIKMSRRQLERLFKKHLNTVPSRYYLQLRMREAREQLLNTSNSIADIGYGCGFSSGAHFSTAYRSLFHITPSEERRLKQRLASGESNPN
jgi:transcriptional regulator GlxA family with amidase domain